MVALTAEDLTGTSASVRAKKSDGTWGPWYEAEAMEGVGARLAGGRPRHRTRVRRPHQHGADRGHPAGPTCADRPHPEPARRRRWGTCPPTSSSRFAQNINAVLISPPQAPVDTLPLPSAVTAPGVPPHIIDRAEWGADEANAMPETPVRQR